MFKSIPSKAIAFDIEWVPDPHTIRVYYQEPDLNDDEAVALAYCEQRLKDGLGPNDQVYLKTSLCRVVSIAAVTRIYKPANSAAPLYDPSTITHKLISIPEVDDIAPEDLSEAGVINMFLNFLGKNKPQLIGFNVLNADLPIMLQRSLQGNVRAPAFFERPEKPWEGVDYFYKDGDYVVDLARILGGYGRAMPSLKELCAVARIPGKMSTDGSRVAGLFSENRIKEILEYNHFDALSTFLLWLRFAHATGHISTEGYRSEVELFRMYITTRSEEPGYEHLSRYLEAWAILENGGVYAAEPDHDTYAEGDSAEGGMAPPVYDADSAATPPESAQDERNAPDVTEIPTVAENVPEPILDDIDEPTVEALGLNDPQALGLNDPAEEPDFLINADAAGSEIEHGAKCEVRWPNGTWSEGTVHGKSGKHFRVLLKSGDKILVSPVDLIVKNEEDIPKKKTRAKIEPPAVRFPDENASSEPAEIINSFTGEVISELPKPKKQAVVKKSAAPIGLFDDI